MINLPPTPLETLEKHHAVAKEVGLNYVYLGNVSGHPLEHTYCLGCGMVVVKRLGFDITGWHTDDQNRCKKRDTDRRPPKQISKRRTLHTHHNVSHLSEKKQLLSNQIMMLSTCHSPYAVDGPVLTKNMVGPKGFTKFRFAENKVPLNLTSR
jgi:hypothetical protein